MIFMKSYIISFFHVKFFGIIKNVSIFAAYFVSLGCEN